MLKRFMGVFLCFGLAALCVGCSGTIPIDAPTQQSGDATTENATLGNSEPAATTDETASETGNADENNVDEEYELKRAGVGVTGKGNYGVTSEQPMSIITTPVSTYFHAKEKTVFDMQIPQALQLFQASEGRFPNSEQEFMDKIIKANMIILPELPEGDAYVYDVPSHTLMVRTKKAQ